MAQLMEYLEKAVRDGASDLFFVAGGPAFAKVEGQLVPLAGEKLLPAESGRLIDEIYSMAKRSRDVFLVEGDDDFSFDVPGLSRFRVNAYRQRGSMAAVIRVVSFDIPDWQEYNIPEEVMRLAELRSGMILFSGTAGSGKTTTQACLVDRINRTRSCHIVTLEDPIEFLHRNRLSIVSQREVAVDTKDFISGLRACLRQAPDVIQLGEMRDMQTIQTAMTAAETGHLVLATLHTGGAIHSVNRVIDVFPANQQEQIRMQLSTVLRTVVSQQLLPDTKGGLVPAFEVMHLNDAIRTNIREKKEHQMAMVLASGAAEGMITMDMSILKLYQEGHIDRETALKYAENREQMLRRMGK